MPFTGGASAPPELPTVDLRPQFYRALRWGQPVLTAHGQALSPTTIPVHRGYVRLTVTEGQPFSLDLLTSSEPYLLPESFAAGWDQIERQGRTDLPIWRRGGLLRQAIPITMDVLKWRGVDIEDEWKALRALARPANARRPPVLKLAGPVDHKELTWTIVGLEPDAESTKRRGHKMVRQSAVITVQQWHDSKNDVVDLHTTKATPDRPRKVLSTEALNTPKKLAKHFNVTVKQLRESNLGLGSDPDRKLPAKTVIWLPSVSALDREFDRASNIGRGTGGARAPS